MSSFAAPAGEPCHHLVVDAEPSANALLRVLEPFMIHDVLPGRIETSADAARLRIVIHFAADGAIAERLEARIATMVTVHGARLIETVSPGAEAAA